MAAARAGAPPSVLARMGLNIGVDAITGAVPVIGDLFDFGWKANRRNLALLERHFADPTGARRSSRAVVAAALGGVLTLVLLVLAGAIGLAAALVRLLAAVV